MITAEIRHAHLCCGIGGGASGFDRGATRVGNLTAKFRCIGGIDVDPNCVADFRAITGVAATRLDLFTHGQYAAFHGHAPPDDWREASPDDIRRAYGGEHPHVLFMSMPCKGFSGLLSEKISQSRRYQALNGLTLRGVWLALEAFQDDPVELILFENVPRIATRGRYLVDHIVALLRAYGYAVAETTHDCGEIGGLAQHRRRFLLVARHMAKVPAFLYEPPKRPLRGVGEILERLPLPGAIGPDGVPLGGAMHRVPALQWKTWVRLALVEAGKDWRSLNRLAVEGGVLRDYGIAADAGWHGGVLGVRRWDDTSGAVCGNSAPTNGAFAVADPRVDGHPKSVQLGVRPWGEPAGVITGKMFAGGGPHSVADPRIEGRPRFNNTFRIVEWDASSPAIAGPGGPAGGLAVADQRAVSSYEGSGKYRVTSFAEPAGCVISGSTSGNGAFAVSDPRPGFGPSTYHHALKVTEWRGTGGAVTAQRSPGAGALCVADPRPACLKEGRNYLTAGHYGVRRWEEPSGAVTGSGQHDNGAWSVADPREGIVGGFEGDCRAIKCGENPPQDGASSGRGGSAVPEGPALPSASDRLVCMIRSLDGTWHRPFTTLECAALQSLVDPDELFVLSGTSDSGWRERIGNCVPRDAAAAIAGVCGKVLLGVWAGQTSMLADEPIWVRDVAVAMAVHVPEFVG